LDQLDLALRSSAITVLFLLAALMLRAPVGRDGRLAVLAVAITQSAFLLTYGAPAALTDHAIFRDLGLVAAAMPMAVTWLLLAIFLDPPYPRWPWLLAAGVVSGSLYYNGVTNGFPTACSALALLLYSGLLVLSLWTAKGDLVERRCRARPGFAAAIAGFGILMTGAQVSGALEVGSPVFALMQSAGTLALALAFALWILRPDADLWPGPTLAAEDPVHPAPSLARPEDAALIARIEAVMEAGIWREESLTIGILASRLAVPEHRLRRAINQGLGHRNFSSFINRARIGAAQDALADPAQMGRTILEIAYDVGFASLGPFNRAFRAETGQSPSEYRREALAAPPADPARSRPIPVNLH